jgi:hypothetical protein
MKQSWLDPKVRAVISNQVCNKEQPALSIYPGCSYITIFRLRNGADEIMTTSKTEPRKTREKQEKNKNRSIVILT